jgi:hypothetical protein
MAINAAWCVAAIIATDLLSSTRSARSARSSSDDPLSARVGNC